VLRLRTSGGGGYGDPEAREARAIAQDISDGYAGGGDRAR